jgi:hypothetical protein
MKLAAVGVGSFLLGATFGLLGVATLTGRYLKRKGAKA